MACPPPDSPDTPTEPRLVGLDWGTTSLRGYLIAAGGRLLQQRNRPWGIRQLPRGGFDEAVCGIAGDWLSASPGLPMIASGMVGSRGGWKEAAYVECPAELSKLAAGLATVETPLGTLRIIPGLICVGDSRAGRPPDVLRGEETQAAGAVANDPSLAEESLLVLPGTHSKWVAIREGRIEGFQTFMTGELFAVLRDHSILGDPARQVAGGPRDGAAAFDRGVAAVRESGPAGLGPRLFSARSLMLTGSLAEADTLEYLSGLLVGEEIRCATAAAGGTLSLPAIAIAGEAALCDRYVRACRACGISGVRLLGETAPAGLWMIAEAVSKGAAA
ncbi:MAG: 2-dehydro-3-deoxygalactonokinase [Planctomycetota bacterium]|jgi:2-dehydro-3-deoxygalactonokinase|nr:2-dehydro-3-deoxygalactonokinase [Planctomycetota bacterium]